MTNLDQQPQDIRFTKEQVPVTPESAEGKIEQIDELFAVGEEILVELEKRVGPVTSENFWDKVKDNKLLTSTDWDSIFTGPLQERENPGQKDYMKALVRGEHPEITSRGEVDPFMLAGDKAILGKLKYE